MGRKQREDIQIADEGEEWVLSYADMMSLLLCFFILLYSTGTANAEKLAVVSRKMKEAFKGLDTEILPEVQFDQVPETKQARAFQLLVQMLDLGDVDDNIVGNIEKKYKEVKNSQVVKERMLKDMGDDASGTISYLQSTDDLLEPVVEIAIPDSLLFLPGKATLTASATQRLKKIADALTPLRTIKEIQVVGHTDSRQPSKTADFQDNWTLSSARAGTIAKALATSGLNTTRIEALGRADTDPIFQEFDPQGHPIIENMAKNRRVEIKVRLIKE